jgi:diadenosine tetraphosphate (Ap4A) HIT family hydrolase
LEECLTCELMQRREAGGAPLWDDIYRTPYWCVVHSFNTALPGWLVIVCRRHIAALDELTEAEAVDLGVLLRRVSLALREATGCVKTYVAQFAEAQGHQHVHVHVIPRMADQPPERRGAQVFRYLGVTDAERVSEAPMNGIAQNVQRHLIEMESAPG